MFKLVLEKAEEPEIKLPTSVGSLKKQESSIKTSISALLTMPKPLTEWITTNWKILKEMGILDHLTCLLRNLYTGQEAIVRTEHGIAAWFQIGKRVWQGCILSPCLFNLHTELCRVDHMKCWGGWLTDWNQDCQEKYQQPQIRRWYPSTGRKWRKTKELLDVGERREWKRWFEIQLSKN